MNLHLKEDSLNKIKTHLYDGFFYLIYNIAMSLGVFIDFDALVNLDNKVWIVDKKNANQPIFKISKSDFNLIKNGIYKTQGNKVNFNGETFWLPTDLWNNIKIKCKNFKINLSDIGISLQEFMNPEVIDNLDFEVNKDFLHEFTNKVVDLYVICSKQVRERYTKIIETLKEKLLEMGMKVKTFYFISDNFMNQNDDEIKFKKIRLILQHLVGYKTEGNNFVDEEITKFDEIHFYDVNSQTLKLTDEINNTLEFLMSRTKDGLREVIKEDIEDFKPILWCHKINTNQRNKIESKKVVLNISKIVKTFENFNPYS